MSNSFDYYHKWLAIPPENQPPNHYQLLALQPFESDPDVIEAAADQRMSHIRSYQSGKNRDLSQQLLNELSAARIVLLDAGKKAEYDERLRQAESRSASETTTTPQVSARPQVVAAPLEVPPPPFDLASASLEQLAPDTSETRRLSSYRPKNASAPHIILAAVAIVLIAVGGLLSVVIWLGNSNVPVIEDQAPKVAQSSVEDPDPPTKSEDAIRAALQTLKSNPEDPRANLTAGKYYCFDRGLWSRGLPMLSKSDDDGLRRLAAADLSNDRDITALGVNWREAAEQQSGPIRGKMLDRAAYWHVESLPSLSSSGQQAAIARVLRIAEQNSETELGQPMDLLELVDVDRHTRRGKWTRSGSDISCAKGGTPLLFIPVKVRGSYRWEIELTQLGNDTIHLVLPAGFSQFDVMLHGYYGDQSEVRVSGKPIVRQRPGRLERNRRHVISADVSLVATKAKLIVEVNGQPHLACETNMTSSDAAIRHANALKIGGSGKSHFTVHSARLTLRSGGLCYTEDHGKEEPGTLP